MAKHTAAHNVLQHKRTSHKAHNLLTEIGKVSIVNTAGNPYGHIILRGERTGSNFTAPFIADAEAQSRKAKLEPRIIIDCSHGNSNKDFHNQSIAWNAVLDQMIGGTASLKGLMFESNLVEGKEVGSDLSKLAYGVSITDSCIGFGETEKLIMVADEKLSH